MTAWIAALFLFAQPQAAEAPVELSAEARAMIASVQDAIDQERARQAALPAPASDAQRLERMGELDQVGRRVAVAVDVSSLPEREQPATTSAVWAPVMALDDALLAELLQMLPPEGWFLRSRYGWEAANAAFLIIQHSDIEQWRRFVPVLEPLAAAGEVEATQFGLMYDRLAVNEGRPQRYGTQMICKGSRWVIDYDNLEDPENADRRRAEAGFPHTLAQYEARFSAYPPCRED
ncbi:hypothetical protein D8I30_12245 [Brevundimonas naejangsanensis]|uniref:Uncharacterized protein n=1 Tax=Brevundimonas naejangsanensis TaxID=588932 RepID=A0A494RRE4_9CAUL|nr:DUF6624 domain-containing protein [Brevundimonas naejangsanensis]AYG95856.1 hypothetical protein D8I30_12245 [Brevundimonas naejangsanensis]